MKKKPANTKSAASPPPDLRQLGAAGMHLAADDNPMDNAGQDRAVDDVQAHVRELLYKSADEPELRDGVEEKWVERPHVLFTDLCACAIMTLESVAATHWECERQDSEELLVGDLCPNVDRFRHFLAIAKAIWESQHLYRFLTQPAVIRASKFEHSRSRFDGCCYHELAIRFGEDLAGGIDAGRTAKKYAAFLRFHTARGDFVADYLQSLRADIRCESAAGLEKWRRELSPPSGVANKANRNRLFPNGPPDDSDVIDVVLRIDSSRGSGRTKVDIARE